MGTLYLVSTPIGNLEDITIRAIQTLFSVDYIACEDSRKTGQLIKNLGLFCHPDQPDLIGTRNDSTQITIKRPKFITYYDEIEFKRIPEIINLLQSGKNIALVSDSGTPLIADPGFKLVRECIKREIKVISIPGTSSVITALIVSGFPCDQFLFLGYLPSLKSKRLRFLKNLLSYADKPDGIHPTIIFFETPHRLREALEDLKDIFGDIEIAIARELTKIHEEIWRGKISQAIDSFLKPKGEFVVLFTFTF